MGTGRREQLGQFLHLICHSVLPFVSSSSAYCGLQRWQQLVELGSSFPCAEVALPSLLGSIYHLQIVHLIMGFLCTDVAVAPAFPGVLWVLVTPEDSYYQVP